MGFNDDLQVNKKEPHLSSIVRATRWVAVWKARNNFIFKGVPFYPTKIINSFNSICRPNCASAHYWSRASSSKEAKAQAIYPR